MTEPGVSAGSSPARPLSAEQDHHPRASVLVLLRPVGRHRNSFVRSGVAPYGRGQQENTAESRGGPKTVGHLSPKPPVVVRACHPPRLFREGSAVTGVLRTFNTPPHRSDVQFGCPTDAQPCRRLILRTRPRAAAAPVPDARHLLRHCNRADRAAPSPTGTRARTPTRSPSRSSTDSARAGLIGRSSARWTRRSTTRSVRCTRPASARCWSSTCPVR